MIPDAFRQAHYDAMRNPERIPDYRQFEEAAKTLEYAASVVRDSIDDYQQTGWDMAATLLRTRETYLNGQATRLWTLAREAKRGERR